MSDFQAQMQALGFSSEDIKNAVVDRLVKEVLREEFYNSDGEAITWTQHVRSKVNREAHKVLEDRINSEISSWATNQVGPAVQKLIENFTIQPTNHYGEKKGPPKTLLEYVVERSEKYISEWVDLQGRSEEECRNSGISFSTSRVQRIAYLLDKHIALRIDDTMRSCLGSITEALGQSLTEACSHTLSDLSKRIRIAVSK